MTVAQLYLWTLLNLLLSPLPSPRRVPREGPDYRFPQEAGVLGRIRGGGNLNFDFDLKYSWGRGLHLGFPLVGDVCYAVGPAAVGGPRAAAAP